VHLTLSKTHELLSQIGQTPRKALGQNFLIDPHIIQKQIQLAHVQPADIVIEIGPGLGALTHALLAAQAQVYAVELDKKLAGYLKANLCHQYPDQLDVLQADAVTYPFGNWTTPCSAHPDKPFYIVANLPYAISTPWLAAVLQAATLPTQMVLMVQKELAQRLSAQPGTKQMSAICIQLQLAYDIVDIHSVSRTVFYPIPGVDSCLMVLKRLDHPYRLKQPTIDCLKLLFNQRRKQLGGMIRSYCTLYPGLADWTIYLDNNHIPLTARAEALTLAHWQALDSYL